MRTLALVGLATVGCAVVAVGPAACSSDSGSAASSDGGAAPSTFAYHGEGCSYDVVPAERNAFVDLALDDAAAPGADPVRVRLGLGGDTKSDGPGYADPSHTAVVTWETASASRAARVRIATTPAGPFLPVSGYSWTTPPPEVGFGANEPATSMHEVHLCGLEAGRTYYYQAGGGAPETWSATQSFTTVPASGAVTVGILGDARDKVDVWQATQRRMRDRAVNLQVTTGDLVFTGTQQSLYDQWLGAIWKDPADPNRFVTLGQQMMVMLAGNHENDAARFFGAFSVPGTGPYAETFASFDAGNTHFVVLDDQPLALLADGDHAKTMLAWLEGDLTRADQNRAKVPFVLVVHHRGLYTTSNHATDSDVLDLRATLAPMYDAHHVDVVVNGHDHAYERTKTLRAGSDARGAPSTVASGAGTVYVVNAGAGADPYSVGAADFIEKSATFGGKTGFDGVYGVLTLDARKLTLTTYGLSASGTDPVLDTLELAK
ncbi:MAG: Ser/Thr protein phosphatase family protein [Myxococcaceae bacterium]|nr:Ser/Thr protein phosphatase family protein [Myxococcaceae bacterium]